ncbi:MAG: hypothetical protein QOE53_962 [Pseudonocardiales bacterium]|nr:hypothetical protein [Pseudonocardiales bacterium]
MNRIAAAGAASPVLSADDKSALAAASLTTDATTVSDAAAALAAEGADVSTVTTPLTDLATQVGQAQTSATSARATALAVPAAPSATGLRTAKAAAHNDLEAAELALGTAAQHLASATAALTALQTPAP